MTWTFECDEDKTTVYWNGEKQFTIDGKITEWENGYPATDEAREAVANTIQSAGTPERIRMQFDLNYGFEERDQS